MFLNHKKVMEGYVANVNKSILFINITFNSKNTIHDSNKMLNRKSVYLKNNLDQKGDSLNEHVIGN